MTLCENQRNQMKFIQLREEEKTRTIQLSVRSICHQTYAFPRVDGKKRKLTDKLHSFIISSVILPFRIIYHFGDRLVETLFNCCRAFARYSCCEYKRKSQTNRSISFLCVSSLTLQHIQVILLLSNPVEAYYTYMYTFLIKIQTWSSLQALRQFRTSSFAVAETNY